MSQTTTIRVTKELYNAIRALSSQQNDTVQTVLEEAVKEYKRRRFFEQMDAAFARLRADEADWKEELSERRAWDGLLMDGIRERRLGS
jgi:predicted transcriptional regulator